MAMDYEHDDASDSDFIRHIGAVEVQSLYSYKSPSTCGLHLTVQGHPRSKAMIQMVFIVLFQPETFNRAEVNYIVPKVDNILTLHICPLQ